MIRVMETFILHQMTSGKPSFGLIMNPHVYTSKTNVNIANDFLSLKKGGGGQVYSTHSICK